MLRAAARAAGRRCGACGPSSGAGSCYRLRLGYTRAGMARSRRIRSVRRRRRCAGSSRAVRRTGRRADRRPTSWRSSSVSASACTCTSLAPSMAPRWRMRARLSVGASLAPLADMQHLARCRRVAAHQHVGDLRQRRALDQAVDAVHVALARTRRARSRRAPASLEQRRDRDGRRSGPLSARRSRLRMRADIRSAMRYASTTGSGLSSTGDFEPKCGYR